MTSTGDQGNSRWTYLALVCIGVLPLLAGCLGGNISEEPTLAVDRPTGSEETCPEIEVLRDRAVFAPRLVPFLDHGKTWPIDLHPGEAVKVSIFSDDPRDRSGPSLPDLRMVDPEGSLILEKEGYSANHHRVPVEANGTHEITVENHAYTERATWIVEIHWYPDSECASP